ncbi:MAG: LysE/ArgO family amino acid transporter [Rhodobacteraceae bacterium]|nr:LysE/ArgO family amino acid transporter [Paracoccaceae bacterium]
MISAGVTGFVTGFALILAIGAQNAFILRQGLLKQHVLSLVLFCSISDALLIAAGVAGFSAIVAMLPWLPLVMLLGGAAFLFAYGAMRLWAAWQGQYEIGAHQGETSLAKVLAIAAAFTWLNPHVYLDTLGLMGAISTQYGGVVLRSSFAIGGAVASFTFFFSLGFGARALAPIMQSAVAWRRLDVLIGIVMWALAVKLLFEL